MSIKVPLIHCAYQFFAAIPSSQQRGHDKKLCNGGLMKMAVLIPRICVVVMVTTYTSPAGKGENPAVTYNMSGHYSPVVRALTWFALILGSWAMVGVLLYLLYLLISFLGTMGSMGAIAF